jgi:hypothetical protein
MAGASKSTCVDVIYKDLHRIPVMYHWVALAVRWWNNMFAARQGIRPMACCAWVEDVKLAVAGSAACWSSHILRTMQCLGLLDPGWRQLPLESLLALSWQEPRCSKPLVPCFFSCP